MPAMDEKTRLAAYAVVELAVMQIDDPSLTQEHRDELAVIMKDVEAQFVALEVAVLLVGVSVAHRFPLGSLVEEMRSRVLAGVECASESRSPRRRCGGDPD
jgi:hypothetical protein